MHCECIEVPSAWASALGLIVNEVVTNAVKHAYADGRSGKLTVRTLHSKSTAAIEISDDGPGFDASAQRDGLGRVLIKRLARQVGGTVEWSGAAPGAKVVVSFPVERP
jgi:two-component sensor histidine kinase